MNNSIGQLSIEPRNFSDIEIHVRERRKSLDEREREREREPYISLAV